MVQLSWLIVKVGERISLKLVESCQHMPDSFVTLGDNTPFIIDLKYTSDDNLMGRPLAGYTPNIQACLTFPALQGLLKLHESIQSPDIKKALNILEPRVLILDTYRPQSASEDFWQWAHSECDKNKADYYPNVDKADFFELGYIARHSSHSRGSTVDCNIVDVYGNQIKAVDMGTPFDFMDILSHPDNKQVGEQVYQNRQLLQQLMRECGFVGIEQEWWHFTLIDEPFPDTYFDFPFPRR